MLVDSHCHLNMPVFKDDLDRVIKNAAMYGVKYMQTICTKLDEFHEIYSIANKYPNIFSSVGIHPNEVENYQHINAELLIDLAKKPKVIAIGETGLDYFYDSSNINKELQKKLFIDHIYAAYITDLPVIVHTRAAEQDTYEILYNQRKKYNFKAVIHCFSASQEFACKMLELGIYISISGIVTFKNAEELRKTIYDIPVFWLLLETDAPYLAPVPMRGKRNEPAYVTYTAQAICNIKGIKINDLSRITTENFQKLFSKASF